MTKQLNGPITSDLPPFFQGVEAVCFDAFGTLVEILDRRRSFAPLFEALPTENLPELKDRLMREPQAIDDWPKLLGVDVDPIVMLDVNTRVAAEVQSIAMRPEMTNIWNLLK